MKLKIRNKTASRKVARVVKKIRIRKKINGTAAKPRLCIFRSAKHVYAQLFDDTSGKCLMTVSSVALGLKETGKDLAKLVGGELAKAAKGRGISEVVFDRNGFVYHGRVKALADGARESGLNF